MRSYVQMATASSSGSVSSGSVGHGIRHSLGRCSLIRGSDGVVEVAHPVSREQAIRTGSRLERIDLAFQSGFTRCRRGCSHPRGLFSPACGFSLSVEACRLSSGVRSFGGSRSAGILGSRDAVVIAAPANHNESQAPGQQQIGIDHITALRAREAPLQ